MPAIRAEVDLLRLPVDAVKLAADHAAQRDALAGRLARAAEMYVLGPEKGGWTLERHAAEVAAVIAELGRLGDAEAVAFVPKIRPEEWDTWSPADLNAHIRAILSAIPLDPVTFQPIPPAVWRNPELRRAD